VTEKPADHNSPSRRALIVEDDEAVRRSLQLLLHWRGYEVFSFSAAGPLLQSEQARNADLLVADFRLPDSNGIEVIRALRRRGWQGRAVLITAFADDEMVQDAKASGFDAVLEKPLHQNALFAALAI
jgi:FixJ family two-component response regulator